MTAEQVRKVVFVGYRHPEVSGGSVYISSMAAGFRDAGYEIQEVGVFPGRRASSSAVHVLLPDEELARRPAGHVHRGLSKLPLRGARVLRKKLALRRAEARLRRLARGWGSDTALVFTHPLSMHWAALLGMDTETLPALIIGQHHSQYSSLAEEPRTDALLESTLGRCDVVTALSQQDSVLFQDRLQVPTFSMANPLSPPFEKALSIPRGEDPGSSTADSTRSFVVLARLSPEKQIPKLMEMMVALRGALPDSDWKLHVFGDGSDAEACRRIIVEHDAGQYLLMHGETDDSMWALRHGSIYLSPSRFEGFGLSILEAASMGIPAIAFEASGGVAELGRNVASRLVPVDDERAFIEAVREALEIPANELASWQAKAREGARNYTGAKVVDAWQPVLRTARSRAVERRGQR